MLDKGFAKLRHMPSMPPRRDLRRMMPKAIGRSKASKKMRGVSPK